MPALHSSLRKAIKDTFKPPSLRIRNESQPSMTVVLPERDTAIWPPRRTHCGSQSIPCSLSQGGMGMLREAVSAAHTCIPAAGGLAICTSHTKSYWPWRPCLRQSVWAEEKSGWSASVSIPRLTKGWIQSQYSPYRTRMPEHICLRLTSSSWSKVACWVGDISSVVQEEALCPLETQQPSLQNNPARQLICSAVQRRQPEAANETCRTLSTSANAKCFRLIKYLRNLPTP